MSLKMSPKVPGSLTDDVSASWTTDNETLQNVHWAAPKQSLGQYTSAIFRSSVSF